MRWSLHQDTRATASFSRILKGSYSTIFIDQAAHASIIAAIPADVVKVMYYDHCDAGSSR
ncbi:MAG: hypothetical protein MZV63_35720 [Marinilabiliales bacterium]|nr:hypothetical protein [Marinilabiliales bacterium]